MDAFLNADQQNNIVQSAAPFVGQNGTVHGTIALAPLTKKQPLDQLVAKACLHLGTWSPMLHNTAEILLRKQAALPRMFYQQVFEIRTSAKHLTPNCSRSSRPPSCYSNAAWALKVRVLFKAHS